MKTNAILAALITTLSTNWVDVPTDHEKQMQVGVVKEQTWVEFCHEGKSIKLLAVEKLIKPETAPVRFVHYEARVIVTNLPYFIPPPTNIIIPWWKGSILTNELPIRLYWDDPSVRLPTNGQMVPVLDSTNYIEFSESSALPGLLEWFLMKEFYSGLKD